MFKPKILDTLKNYNQQQFFKDLIAGIIVGIVALPLAIAFAIASGVSPKKELFTAIIAGFVISAVGENSIRPAFIIAILGGIESLLSAVVSDGMIVGNHKSNIELVAQGGANIASAIFGGIPATGAIARTATKGFLIKQVYLFCFLSRNFRGANSFQHDVDVVVEVPEREMQ